MPALEVYLHEKRAGLLECRGTRLRFSYDLDWLATADAPLSLGLPLREAPYAGPECRPFFAGLTPEGDFRKKIARALDISADNPFAMLREIGGECAGAVSLVEVGTAPPFLASPEPRWLSDVELASLLEELPTHPLMADENEEEGIRLSLAGTRDKLGVLLKDARIGITRGRPPSTHIIKVPPPQLSGLVANEAYCMSLADEVGLDVATVQPLRAAGREALLVERYDRFSEGSAVRRLHQEDLCQASGRPPEAKYESEGGPGVADCGALIRANAGGPAVAILRFLDALLFNVLIGNADAHSKNYSLLLEGPGGPKLAPLYDLISTRAYGRRYGRKMGMKYGGEYRPDWIRGRHLDRLGDALGIAHRRVRKHADEMATLTVRSRGAVRERLQDPWRQDPILDSIEETIDQFADVLSAAAAEPA